MLPLTTEFTCRRAIARSHSHLGTDQAAAGRLSWVSWAQAPQLPGTPAWDQSERWNIRAVRSIGLFAQVARPACSAASAAHVEPPVSVKFVPRRRGLHARICPWCGVRHHRRHAVLGWAAFARQCDWFEHTIDLK
eukprot:1431400-Amphidinium_carterae.1